MSSITPRNTLKGWFRRGMKPLESQFAAWIDAFWHKEDLLPTSSIDGLETTLNKKAETADVQQIAREIVTHADNLTAHKTAGEQNKLNRLADDPDASYARKNVVVELQETTETLSDELEELGGNTYRKEETYSRSEVDAKERGMREYVLAKIAEVVDGSPDALNTLYEIATALGEDPNFAATIMEQLAEKANKEHAHTVAEITNFPAAMPASDVAAWAKAATKPDYSFTEITEKPTTLAGYGILDGISCVVEMGDQVYTNTEFQLPSNVFFIWGNVTGILDLALIDQVPADCYNEYIFQFTAAADSTSLVLPDTVQWADEMVPEIKAGKVYQVSIVNNLAVFAEF